MKNKNIKSSIANIVFSCLVFVLGIASFIISFFQEVGVVCLVFALLNMIWTMFNLLYLFKSSKTKVNKVLMSLLFLWSFMLSLNLVFVYFNIFLKFAGYSTLVLMFVVFVIISFARPMSDKGEKLVADISEAPISIAVILLALVPTLVIFDEIKELKRLNNSKLKKQKK